MKEEILLSDKESSDFKFEDEYEIGNYHNFTDENDNFIKADEFDALNDFEADDVFDKDFDNDIDLKNDR